MAPSPRPPVREYRPLVFGAAVGLDKAGSKFTFGSSYQLNVDFQVLRPLALRALVRLPAASSQTTLGGATGEVHSVLAVAGVAVGVDAASFLRLDLFAGVGGARVVALGFPPPGKAALTWRRATSVFVGAGGGRAAFRIAPVVSVTAHAGVAVSAQPVEIIIYDQEAAVWGRPSLFFGIGLELRPDFR